MNRRTILRVESLDARITPTSLALPGMNMLTRQSSAGLFAIRTVQSAPRLTGVAGGVYGAFTLDNHRGTEYDLAGTGDLAHIGHLQMAGRITTVPTNQAGFASGMIGFFALRGSVTIKLIGPQQAANSPLPAHMTYTVIGTSGIYTGMQSTGTVDVTLNSAGSTFTLTFHPTPPTPGKAIPLA
jgi:hypothetical protein